ncbi:hypothetical protein NUACC26_019260 [Scytonema sp. NUACC26]
MKLYIRHNLAANIEAAYIEHTPTSSQTVRVPGSPQ